MAAEAGGGVPAPRGLGYVEAFDGIRGVAVHIVLISHLNAILPIPMILVVPGAVVPLDMFFVLSGFLITALLLQEQRRAGAIDIPAFYQRRALRLFPALALVVVAHLIYALIAGLPRELEFSSLLSIVFYYSNWQMALAPKDFLGGPVFAEGLQHLWSLSVEEQFYLVWPLLVLLVGRRWRLRAQVGALLVVIVAVGVHRAAQYHAGVPWSAVVVRTDTRADAPLVGALLAFVWAARREPLRLLGPAAWAGALALLPILAWAPINGPFLYYGGLSLIDWSCGAIVLAAIDGRWTGNRLFRLGYFVRSGRISYGLYLWHLPIYAVVRRYGSHDLAGAALALALTAAFALASWRFLEQPALRWKRYRR
jgi:peptidoglycan/LPS O-acetylase OafA/YrhL